MNFLQLRFGLGMRGKLLLIFFLAKFLPLILLAEFVNAKKEWPAPYLAWHDTASRCMDLWSLTRCQLAEAGIKPGNIHALDLCTYRLNALFFSHRRGDLGRQMALIWRT
ncbi:hypothetical protein FACS1894206_10110 [Deltaproteobacteria bacterium]|nr:hypothetical protein FACS1894206_10110 [Deltaproteobacteria bacterium]